MNPLVSVIIPVYNVAPYVQKCVESLCQQSFKNYELIFVNDASTDTGFEIVKQTAKQFQSSDFSIQFIDHNENKGVVQARKTGLEIAKGEYVLFVDSDDFVETDMLEILYNKAIETNADIVTSDMFLDYRNDSVYFSEYLSDASVNHFTDICFGNYFSHSLCNKLVKRHLHTKAYELLTYNMTYYEDKFIAIRIYLYAQKIVKVNKAFYHYIKYNSTSATQNVTEKTYQSVAYYWKSLEELLRNENLTKKYDNQLSYNKLKDFTKLLLNSNQLSLIKKHSQLFSDADQQSAYKLRKGEKLLLFCVRHKLFIFTFLIRKFIILKNK